MPDPAIPQAFQQALAHHQAGHLEAAERIYRQILERCPDHADALHLLGLIRLRQGQLAEAMHLIKEAIAHNPRAAIYHNSRGQVLENLGSTPEAEAAYRQALELDPNYFESRINLGNFLARNSQPDEAVACYRAAIALNPRSGETYSNLANLLKDVGEVDQAIACYRRAVELRSDQPLLHSNLLLCLHYPDRIASSELAQEHQRWAARHAAFIPGPAHRWRNPVDPERRLKIGYVSPDFREHAVARFIAAPFEHHDPTAFEVIAYADVLRPDAMTRRLATYADGWRDIARSDDAAVAEMIRRDGIDILVDLAGHSARNRMPLFARRCAPIQVSYLGYPDTTGLKTVDYRIVDRWSDPEGHVDDGYSERLWRLPSSAWCYTPPEDLPEPRPRGKSAEGRMTFGSFNTLAKLSATTLELWSDVLRKVPHSTLVLKAAPFAAPSVQKKIAAHFIARGVAPERLQMLPWSGTLREHYIRYDEIDLALDTFPFHGTTTTCDALWMGVPVITLAGSTHHARVGVSLLHSVGLDQCVAHTAEQFVRRAEKLANSPEELASLRSHLRSLMAASPLGNRPRFTRQLEAAWRGMWRQWCQSSCA